MLLANSSKRLTVSRSSSSRRVLMAVQTGSHHMQLLYRQHSQLRHGQLPSSRGLQQKALLHVQWHKLAVATVAGVLQCKRHLLLVAPLLRLLGVP